MKQPVQKSTHYKVGKSTWLSQYWFVVVLAIAALFVGLSVANFYRTHTKISAPPIYQLSQSANNNEFYASQLFLQSLHKQVKVNQGESANQELQHLWLQPDSEAKKTTVILLSVGKEQESEIPAIIDWIKRGGHLLTFSQDTLSVNNEDDSEDEDRLSSYQLNENALLNYVGVKNIQMENPHEKEDAFEKLASTTASTPVNASAPILPHPSLNPVQSINLDFKVLLRVPVKNNEKGLGLIMASTNMGHLDTQEFWQKYPQAELIANYNWFNNPNNPQALTLLDASHWQSIPLNDQQLNTLKQKIIKEPQKFVPADQALLDVKLGEGRLTIANDNEIFTNPNSDYLGDPQNQNKSNSHTLWNELTEEGHEPSIAQFDNAYLLKYLLTDRQNIWLVPDISVPSLPTLLWQNLKWACIAFMVCVLAGLLALPKRFGRWQVYHDDSQANIFGYFDHVGEYLWQNDKAHALVAQNRERLLDKILGKYPQLAITTENTASNSTAALQGTRQINRQQVCQIVAEDLGIGQHSVALALFEPWQDENQFLQISREFAFLNQRI